VARHAVVLTHNRLELLRQCVAAVLPQVDQVTVVDNASDPPVDGEWPDGAVILNVPDQPPNLARLWNTQLEAISASEPEKGTWEVALLCDDVVVPPDWYDRVATGLREWGASAASAHSYEAISSPYLLRELSNGGDRMCPWAFMLPGEQGLRADESLHWWYCDTDVDWQARQRCGTVIVAGAPAPNLRVGEYTARPDLAHQAGLDGRTFQAKWGHR
jgi:hypothetical protein